jgi:hypothetical protein
LQDWGLAIGSFIPWLLLLALPFLPLSVGQKTVGVGRGDVLGRGDFGGAGGCAAVSEEVGVEENVGLA